MAEVEVSYQDKPINSHRIETLQAAKQPTCVDCGMGIFRCLRERCPTPNRTEPNKEQA